MSPACRVEMPDLQAVYEEFNEEIMLIGLDVSVLLSGSEAGKTVRHCCRNWKLPTRREQLLSRRTDRL